MRRANCWPARSAHKAPNLPTTTGPIRSVASMCQRTRPKESTAWRLSDRLESMAGYESGPVGRFKDFLEPEAYQYFGHAQAAQDTGETWGAAQKCAEAWVNGRDWRAAQS